jgi:hypothetical protein
LWVLDHHQLGDRDALAVGGALGEHLLDQCRGDGVAVEGDVDVTVDRLDGGEEGVVRRRDAGSDLLGQLRHALAHSTAGEGLRLLLGEPLQLAARLQVAHDDFVAEGVGDRGGETPRSLEGEGPKLDLPRAQAEIGNRRRHRLRRLPLAARDDAPLTASVGGGGRGRRRHRCDDGGGGSFGH